MDMARHRQRRSPGRRAGRVSIRHPGRSRQTAFEYRTIARAGGDPLALKQRPDMPTFAEAVETVIGIHREGWKDAGKSEKQWRASLGDYAMRRLGQKRVDQITTADVMAVLIPPLAHEERNHAARAPAYWHGDEVGCRAGLPRRQSRRRRDFGRAAEEWQRAPASARVAVRGSERCAPRSEAVGCVRAHGSRLRVSGLDGLRSGEVRLATWDEIDFDTATWTVPANRMKSKRDHRVPLSARTQGVLQEAREFVDSSGLVFPSPRGGAISANTISKLLRQLDTDAVPHGFCSSFRDWAAECSDATREVCELALAHVNSDRVEAAYRRTDLFEQRRVLMEQWSGFVGQSAEGGEDHAWRSVSHPTHR